MVKNEKVINLEFDLIEAEIDIDIAIPLGLIVNEIITNSFKYAFPDRKSGCIKTKLDLLDNGMLELAIKDDGIGLPDNIVSGKGKNLGLRIVELLTEQIKGDVQFINENGCKIVIRFKNTKVDRLK
jgi:two-component sensor histidine kinase